MTPLRLLLVATTLMASLAAGPAARAENPSSLSCSPAIARSGGNPGTIAGAGNDFGFRLFANLFAGNAARNVFISPMSTALALDMTYNGARGSTQQAMAVALGLQGMSQQAARQGAAALLRALQSSDPKAGLTVANSLWARSGVPFQGQFLQEAKDYYGARVATLDFRSPAAPQTINGWVRCATHGKIPSIVDRIPASMIMYLINAVYFHGQWTSPFTPAHTRPQPFTTASGQQKSLPLMSQTGRFPYYQGPDFQAISLPYSTGRFGMAIILPQRGLSLQTFGRRLSAANWQAWMSRLQLQYGSIAVPRFSLTNTFQLERPLKDLGMGAAFSHSADFSGMCVRPCRISEVRHKTYLKVDEKGTTAAGVTSVGVEPTAVQAQSFNMAVDRPFFLAIRDQTTNAVLFLGAVNDP